jgi:hypothetical protein
MDMLSYPLSLILRKELIVSNLEARGGEPLSLRLDDRSRSNRANSGPGRNSGPRWCFFVIGHEESWIPAEFREATEHAAKGKMVDMERLIAGEMRPAVQ